MSWQNDPVEQPTAAPWDRDPVVAPSPRDTLKAATRVNPDQAAEAERLARRYPNPSDVVLRNLTDVKLQAAVDDADARLRTDVPTLQRRMTELPFAQVSHDDTGPLSGIEGVLRQTGRSAKSGVFGASRGAAGVFQAGAELAAPLLDVLEPDSDAELMGWRGSIGGNPLRRLAEGFAAIGQQNLAVQQGLRPQQPGGDIASGFFSGVESLTQNVLALPLAFAPGGQGAALTMMSASTGGNSYQDARQKGLAMSLALPFAASQAAIEYATEKLPLTRLLGDVKAGTPILQTLARQVAAEIPGEQVATVLQDLNEWAVLNPDKPFTSYLEERPSAAAQTLVATIVGAGGNVAVAKAIESVANLAVRRDAEIAKGDADARRLEALAKLAAESRLRERAPETFAEFVQQAAENTEGAPTAVYVDARALTDALNQVGISDDQLAQLLPSVPAQIAEAFESGGTVEIPIGEAMAAAPGTPLEQVLLQNARTDPDGLSRLEVDEAAKQADQFVKAEADRIMQSAQMRAEVEENAAQVKQTVLDQLNATGRFRPEANDAYATMVGAFYATMAQRTGMTPADLYARYPLRVTGEMQTGAALEQGGEPAVRAELLRDRSPVTGKPEFALYDAAGNHVGIYRSATSAAEAVANFNNRRTVQSQPEPQVRVDAPQAAGANEPRSNWKIVRGQKFTNLDEDDGYLYHVTSSRAATDIIRSGLVPNSPRTFGNAYAGHSANRVFLTERSGVSYWQEKVEQNLQSLYDRPPAVTVVRIPKAKITAQLQPDKIGSADARSPAYYAEGEVLSQTDGKFKPVNQQTRATFSPSQMLIALGPNADYSSFLHETGHFWLEVLADIASQPGAPQQVADDFNTTMQWFGVTPEQWAGMTLDEKRPHHERWAESVEQYFFEGRAPSVELRGVFDRFRTWLTSVYKSLKQFLAMRSASPGGRAGQGELAQSAASSLADVRAQWDAAGIKNAVSERDGAITLSQIIVPKDERSSGKGTAAMQALVDYADATGQRVVLTPSSDFGGSKSRLVQFYKRFGFVENKGRNKDYTTMEGMYREAQTLAQSDNTAGPLGLSDEIRAVMDRLLATDEQIAEAERVRQYGLLFKSPEEAGMTPEQWAAYTSEDEKAHAAALAELTKRNLRDLGIVMRKRMRALRDVQRDMAEKRKAVEQEAAAQVAQEPVYRAMRWLKKGEMTTPDGEDIKATDGFKLDRASVDVLFPESMPGRPDMAKLRGMTVKTGGLSPDIVAEMFGFRDGAHLVASITEAFPQQDQVDGLTDQMMLERYGDLTTARGQERAADEAVHNENRARVLAAEMAAVSAANNARAPGTGGRTVNAMVAAAKQFASRLVESKRIKDLKPQQHTAAETRAARAAEKALAAGKTEEVIQAKRDQLLNFHAAKATNDARTEALKTLAWFKRVAEAKDDTAGKSRDLDVVKAMQSILAAYGVGAKRNKTAAEYMELVRANDPAMFAALEPSITAAMANAKPVGELAVAELRVLDEELRAMWHLAKRSRQMEVDGNLLDIEDAADQLKGRMQAIGIPDSVPGDTSAITPAEQRALKLKGFLAAARRVESWAQAKDGAGRGPFRSLVWEPVREAADRYRVEKAKQLKAFKALLEPIAPTLTKRKIVAPELGYTFGEDTDGVALAEILHAVLHTGNESNKRKLLLGRKWATENADGTLDTSRWDAFIQRMVAEGVLRREHFDFAQGVWDLLEGMKPLAQKAHRDAFGRYFNEVTADEFVDPFGIRRRGGYVPAQADARIVSDQATKRLMEDENASMQFAFPSTARGFTKSRTEYNRPLLLDLRSLSQHIDKVLLFSHMENPVRDVRKLLTNKGVAYGLNRLDPVAFDSILTPWLNRAAKQQVETPVAGDAGLMRFFSALRRRAGMAAMFANVANAAQQLAGFSMAAVRVKPSYLAGAMAQYVAAPRLTAEMVASKSQYMETRMANEVANMTDAINDILLDPSTYEKTKAFLTKHSYFLQSAVDNVMSPVIWTGAYNQALAEGAEDKDAVRAADSAVRETQGSTAPEDISRIESGNAFVRLFTQFAGYFNMQANLLGTEFNTVVRDLGLRKGLGRGLYVLLFGFLVNAWAAEAIMQLFKGGPDDEDKDGDYLDDWLAQVFGWSLVRNTTAMMPVAGQIATTLVNTANSKPYDDRISTSPAISMIESAVRVPSDVYKIVEGKDVKPSKVIRDVATLTSLVTGIPANAFAKPIGYLADVEAGKVEPTSATDAVRGTVTGVASPESKQ